MNIERIYYPVLTLGPGRRLGIWTRGCPRKCPGCMSEDMQKALPAAEIPIDNLIRAADSVFSSREVDGVTISGGEPLQQAAELARLLRYLRQHTNDILLYTGYTTSEIEANPLLQSTAALADVLVTGPYIAERNDGLPLRGSSNQDIIFNTLNLKQKYAQVFETERAVQIGRGPHDVFLIGLLG